MGQGGNYLLSAGRRALFASATREAVEHFERALLALRRLPPTPDTLRTAITLRLNLRDPLWSLGEVERIRDELIEAELVARQLDDAPALGRVAAYRCQYLSSSASWARRWRPVRTPWPLPLRSTTRCSSPRRSCTRHWCSWLRVTLSEPPTSCRTRCKSRRRSGQRPGTTNRATVIRLLALSFLTRALAELGRFTEGIAYGEEALRLAEPNMAFGLATALAGLGILYVRKADAHTAIPLLERGLEASRTYSVTNWIPTLEATLGTAYVLAGRVKEGVVLLEHAVDLNRHPGIVATLSLWRTYLGDAYLKAGRIAEAVSETRRALGECRARLDGYEPWALHVVAGILAASEPPDVPDAHAHYTEALKLAESRGMRPLTARCLVGLARLHERAGNAAAAASYRDRAVIGRRARNPSGVARRDVIRAPRPLPPETLSRRLGVDGDLAILRRYVTAWTEQGHPEIRAILKWQLLNCLEILSPPQRSSPATVRSPRGGCRRPSCSPRSHWSSSIMCRSRWTISSIARGIAGDVSRCIAGLGRCPPGWPPVI